MKKFEDLSRRTQRNKFKELGIEALLQYGIHEGKLRFISDTSNVIFRVDTSQERYVLRIDPELISPSIKMRIEVEMHWLFCLRRDTDLEVPQPVRSAEGSLVTVATTTSLPDGRYVSLLKWMDGRLIGENPSLKSMRQLGTFMAKLHKHADRFALPPHLIPHETSWEKLTYWHDPQIDSSKNLTPYQQEICAAASKKLLDDKVSFNPNSASLSMTMSALPKSVSPE